MEKENIIRKAYVNNVNKKPNGEIKYSYNGIHDELKKHNIILTKGQHDYRARTKYDREELWKESRKNLPTRDEENFGANKNEGLYYSKKFIELDVETKATPEEIMLSHGYDPNEFILVEAGSTGSKIGTKANDEQYFINRYNKIRVRPKEPEELTNKDIEKLITDEIEPLEPMEYEIKNTDRCFLVNFFDVHVGSDGYSRKFMMEKVEAIRHYILNNNISEVKITFGGDFLHVEDTKERTVADTQLKLLGTAYDMVREGELMARYIIDRLSIFKTEIIWVLGNHSALTEYQLFDKVAYMYKDQKHIKFQTDESPYKAFVYGNQFIMLSHGNIPIKTIESIPSQRFSSLWSKAKYWEVHLGHFHKESLRMFGNLVVRYQRTPKATDSWEYYKGWFNDLRHVQAYTIDKEDGIVDTHYY